jgi:hypothetical protein
MSEHTKKKSAEDKWKAMASAPLAVATLVQDDIKEEDWLQVPTEGNGINTEE